MKAIGFHIEGIGQIDGFPRGYQGTLFYASAEEESWLKDSAQRYSFVESLIELPSESESKADPKKGDLSLAAYNPKLALTGEVSRLLNARQSKPTYYLHSDATSQQTTLNFGAAGLFGTLPVDLYIGEETIIAHTDNGDGTYECYRGMWNSTPTAHAGSSNIDEQRAGVFERPPFYENRLIYFVVIDEGGNIHQRALGKWSDDSIENANTRLAISSESAYQLLKNSSTYRAPYLYIFNHLHGFSAAHPSIPNEAMPDGVMFSQVAKRYDSQGQGNLHWYGGDSSGYDPGSGSWEARNLSYSRQAFHVKRKKSGQDEGGSDSAIILASMYPNKDSNGDPIKLDLNNWGAYSPNSIEEYKEVDIPLSGKGRESGIRYSPDPADPPLSGGSQDTGSGAPSFTIYEGWEVAHWNIFEDVCPYPPADAKRAFDDTPRLGPVDESIAFHPLCVAASLLFSTDSQTIRPDELDLISSEMSLKAGFLFGDEGKQSFIDLAQKTSGKEIAKFTVGFGGGPVDVFNQVLHLLVSNGFFLAPSQDGFLKVAQWETMTAGEIEQASTRQVEPIFHVQGDVTWEWGKDDEVQRHILAGMVGGNEVVEGIPEEALALEASSRLTKMIDPDSRDYSFPFLRRTPNIGKGPGEARTFLRRQAELLQARMPTVTFEAPDPSTKNFDYDVGTWINIQNPKTADPPLFFDENGDRVDPSNQTEEWQFYGMIIANQWNPTTNRYTLTCVLTNYDVSTSRLRAPAGIVKNGVSSSSAPTTIDLETNSFASGQDDATTFEIGQWVVSYEDRSLSRNTGNIGSAVEIVDIVGNSIVVDGAVTVNPGDIITLAYYDDSQKTTSQGLHKHAFMADGNDELGTQGDDGHRWQ